MRYIKNYNLFEDNSELYQVVSDEVYGSKIEGIVPIIQEEIDIINDMIQEKFEDVSVRKSPTTEFEKILFGLDLGDICVDLHFFKDHDDFIYILYENVSYQIQQLYPFQQKYSFAIDPGQRQWKGELLENLNSAVFQLLRVQKIVSLQLKFQR